MVTWKGGVKWESKIGEDQENKVKKQESESTAASEAQWMCSQGAPLPFARIGPQ